MRTFSMLCLFVALVSLCVGTIINLGDLMITAPTLHAFRYAELVIAPVAIIVICWVGERI